MMDRIQSLPFTNFFDTLKNTVQSSNYSSMNRFVLELFFLFHFQSRETLFLDSVT